MCELLVSCTVFVFFFKQKTAYEMRISDWSSDVCSSDLCATKALTPRDHTSTLRAKAMRELTSAQRPTVARSVIRTMTAYVTKASSALMKVSDSTIPVREDRKSTRLNSSH